MIHSTVLVTLCCLFLIRITESKHAFRENSRLPVQEQRDELQRHSKNEKQQGNYEILKKKRIIGRDDLRVEEPGDKDFGHFTACNKQLYACVVRIVSGKVCGFQQSTNEFKVYPSRCYLYTHACQHRLAIAVVDMARCEEDEKQGEKGITPPKSAFIRPENTVVHEGSDVTLMCFVIGGNPPPAFSWSITPRLKRGRVNDNDIATTSSMTLKKITKGMAGTYTCTAYNTAGTVSASTTIDVQYKPTVTVSPSYVNIKKGGSALFKCSATGNPKPRIVWKKGTITKSTSSTLLVRNAQLYDHGTYRCVATNTLSSFSAEVRLNVRVDGGWSSKASWSCTKCGKNPYDNQKCQKKCERKCNNPTPRNGGDVCSGDVYIEEDCSENQCSKPNKDKDCFPGDAVVPLANGGTKFMQHLKIGDNVLAVTSANQVISSKVLTFLHREEATQRVYQDIQTDNNTISLTSKHLIFVSEDGDLSSVQTKFASTVETGMYISEINSGRVHLARVKTISNSTRTGLYAPLTEHGNIVVNHVMSSCYAIINSHRLAHIGLSPLRWYYMYGGLLENDVPKEGIHWYASMIQSTFFPQFLLG